MNERNFDRRLAAWLDEGPASVSDRVIEGALAQIPTTTQRGAGPAPLRSLIMRMQPAVPILGLAAAVAIAAAAYFAFWQPQVGGPDATPTPSPEGARVQGAFTATVFSVPIIFQLDAAPSPDGWHVVERPSLVQVSADPGAPTYLALIPLDDASVPASGRTDGLSPNPEEWFEAMPGFTIEPMSRFDAEGPMTWNVDGQEVQTYVLTVDPAAAGDSPLFATGDGDELRADPDTTATWLVGVAPHAGGDLLIAYAGWQSEGTTNIGGSVFAMIESIEFR